MNARARQGLRAVRQRLQYQVARSRGRLEEWASLADFQAFYTDQRNVREEDVTNAWLCLTRRLQTHKGVMRAGRIIDKDEFENASDKRGAEMIELRLEWVVQIGLLVKAAKCLEEPLDWPRGYSWPLDDIFREWLQHLLTKK